MPEFAEKGKPHAVKRYKQIGVTIKPKTQKKAGERKSVVARAAVYILVMKLLEKIDFATPFSSKFC